jgi:hypothetical protein
LATKAVSHPQWLLRVGVVSAALMALCACGPSAASPTPTPEATVAATVVPAVARAAPSAVPSPSPQPTATAALAAAATTVWVANTEGQGVYVRKTPNMADRLKAYPDGTALTIIGDDVDADGQHWKHVRTPDGLEGYVPSIYTVDSQP